MSHSGSPASHYRPGPLSWLRYAWGGRLPRHREWVRHDLLDAGWRWRAAARSLSQLGPIAVVVAVLPAPVVVRVLVALLVLLSGLFVSVAYAEELRDRRLRQHGWPVPDREPPPSGAW